MSSAASRGARTPKLYQDAKVLYWALVRRRQRRRLTWARFWERIAPQLPRARLVHNFFVPPVV